MSNPGKLIKNTFRLSLLSYQQEGSNKENIIEPAVNNIGEKKQKQQHLHSTSLFYKSPKIFTKYSHF